MSELEQAARRLLSVYDKRDMMHWQEAIDWLRAALVSHQEEVPEVEVSHMRSPVVEIAPEAPLYARRSAAKNVSEPRLQEAFISSARASMGQPGKEQAAAFLGQLVTLVFNDDRAPVSGVLTNVSYHPAGTLSPTPYLVLDDDKQKLFPLHSVQEIRPG